jgi:hypothetical protein
MPGLSLGRGDNFDRNPYMLPFEALQDVLRKPGVRRLIGPAAGLNIVDPFVRD